MRKLPLTEIDALRKKHRPLGQAVEHSQSPTGERYYCVTCGERWQDATGKTAVIVQENDMGCTVMKLLAIVIRAEEHICEVPDETLQRVGEYVGFLGIRDLLRDFDDWHDAGMPAAQQGVLS